MTTEAPPAQPVQYGNAPIELIDIPSDHVLRPIDKDFCNSIESEGLLTPVLLRQNGDRFDLIDGGRRLQAVRELGHDKISAQVRGADETTRRIFRTITNVQREQFHPLEEAREYELLATEDGLSNQEIARRIGRSPLHVTQRRALLSLPESYQRLIHSQEAGALTLGEALELVRLVDDPAGLDAAYNLSRAGTPIDKAVQAQLHKRAGSLREDETRKNIVNRGDVVFEGKVGADGWVVARDEPAPGYLYWPEDRELHSSFQYLANEDGGEFVICPSPLLFMQDSDPQVAASAQALASLGQGDTAAHPARSMTVDEAQKAREAAERRITKDFRKQDELREATLTKLARSRVTSDQYDMIFEAFCDALTSAQRDTVFARCNVARVEAQEGEGFGERWDLAGYLGGRGSWARLAYAAAIQVREDELDSIVKQKLRLLPPGRQADRMAAYLEHLEGRGYALSAGERDLVGLEGDEKPPEDAEKPEEGVDGGGQG